MLLWIRDGVLVASPAAARSAGRGGDGRWCQSIHDLAVQPGSPRTTRTAPAGCSRPTSTRWWRKGGAGRPRTSRRWPRSSGSTTSTSSSSTRGNDGRAGPAPPSPGRGEAQFAAWLAAPAPMRSLSFFSPTQTRVGVRRKEPRSSILDEMVSIRPTWRRPWPTPGQHGFDLRNDLNAPLGGGTRWGSTIRCCPRPTWKLVAGSTDPARLQQNVQKAVTQIDAELKANGEPGVQRASSRQRTDVLFDRVTGGRPRHHLPSCSRRLPDRHPRRR